MKTLADFKKAIKPSVKLHTNWYDPRQNKWIDKGIREVKTVQTNAFTLLTEVQKNGISEIVESWCYYPKAKDFKIISDKEVHILWEDGSPCLQYTFI